jgi:hypothetical protein
MAGAAAQLQRRPADERGEGAVGVFHGEMSLS